MAKYKIGIIGFGKIARDQHAPAIQASANFELVARWRHRKSGGNSGFFVWTPEEALRNAFAE